MELIPIAVKCHAGYKADEYPKSFVWYEKEYEIVEIIDRWYQGEHDSDFPAANYFKVRADRGGQFLIRHEMLRDQWYLLI